MADPIPHPAHGYDIKDTTTGDAWQADGTPYAGPVAGLTDETVGEPIAAAVTVVTADAAFRLMAES